MRKVIAKRTLDAKQQVPHFYLTIESKVDKLIELRKKINDTISGKVIEDTADVIFAADGAFSSIRYNAMQKLDRFNYSQRYIQDGYKELLLPANPDGSYQIEKNALHIWPRGRFMLIALPNEDGSFTCTLFMPYDGCLLYTSDAADE